MLSIEILAVGRLKNGPMYDLLLDYQKKIRWSFTLHEIESRHRDAKAKQDDEHSKLTSLIKPSAFVIALDERGKSVKSLEFSRKIQSLQDNAYSDVQFILGGADGLQDDMRKRANMLLSFGNQTWPHMLARVMLVEQIYRAQQILAGHPYHRE